MKILAVFVYACAVVTLGEGRTVVQRPTAGAETTEVPRACPSDLAGRGDKFIGEWTRTKVIGCITNSSTAVDWMRLAENRTLTWMRREVEEFCQAVPTMESCLDGVVATTAICLEHSREILPFFNMMTDLYETAFVYLCADTGEQAAKLFHGLMRHKIESSLTACNYTRVETLAKELQTVSTTTEMSLKIYGSVPGFKDCLLDSIKNDDETKILLEAFMDNQIKNYKCIDPENNTLVLCEKLNGIITSNSSNPV